MDLPEQYTLFTQAVWFLWTLETNSPGGGVFVNKHCYYSRGFENVLTQDYFETAIDGYKLGNLFFKLMHFQYQLHA